MSQPNPRQTYSTYKKPYKIFLHIHPESRTQNCMNERPLRHSTNKERFSTIGTDNENAS